MAIYHLHAKVAKKGRDSAAEKMAYICRTGRYADPARDACQVSWSGNLPTCAADSPADFWAAADLHERKRGCLCRSYDIALPRDLPQEAQRQCADAIIHQIAGTDLPFTAAIHAGRGTNPHLHLMVSERENSLQKPDLHQYFKRYSADGKGGARKTDRLKGVENLLKIRKNWETIVNQQLEKHGIQQKITADRQYTEKQHLKYEDYQAEKLQNAVKIANETQERLQKDYIKAIEELQQLEKQHQGQLQQQQRQEEIQKKEAMRQALQRIEARQEAQRHDRTPAPRPTPR